MQAKLISFPLSFDHGAVVYCLQNTKNGKVYIGKTTNFFMRMTQHRGQLQNGNHPNKEMQADFDNGDDFLIICLFRYPAISEKYMREHAKDIDATISRLEQEFIREFDAIERGYNKQLSRPPKYPPSSSARSTLRPCEDYAAELEIRNRRNIV